MRSMAALAATPPWFMAAATGERIVAFAQGGKPPGNPFFPCPPPSPEKTGCNGI